MLIRFCSRLLYTVLFDIASCIEGNPNNDKANLIKPCIDYIKSNYMHDISISALAEMIKVTPTYLGIIFKKVYNITPQKFLTNIRIENSKQLFSQQQKYVTFGCCNQFRIQQ